MTELEHYQKESEEARLYWKMYRRWVENLQNGKRMDKYLMRRGIQCIAIYGMGWLGHSLYQELRDTDINVKYVIDQNAMGINLDEGVRMVMPDEALEEVDAIIITPLMYYGEIFHMLRNRIDYPLFSIEELIFEM